MGRSDGRAEIKPQEESTLIWLRWERFVNGDDAGLDHYAGVALDAFPVAELNRSVR
jgi:hypothetical protein